MSIAILVPFRDEPSQNRAQHLRFFLEHMPSVCEAALGPRPWRIFVGVQGHDGRKFCRGRVLNALVRLLPPEFTRIVLHDVDLIPSVERARGFAAPLGSRVMALNTTGEYADMRDYIGGICAMDRAVFDAVDGFPNEMEGWGGEDDALRDRIGPRNIVAHTDGTVRNLETELEAAWVVDGANPFVRAKHVPALKMPKEDRRHVRDLWRRGDPTITGAKDLLFTAEPRATDAVSTTFALDVTGWSPVRSATHSRTYYFHAPTGRTQWDPPTPTDAAKPAMFPCLRTPSKP